MTPYRSVIDLAVRASNAPIELVMRDHLLSYIIAAISNDEVVKDRIVFKGGTAIRKCYVADYRFSEDLDYTVRDGGRISAEDLEAALHRIALALPQTLPAFSPPFAVDMVRVMRHREEHPLGQQQGKIVVRTPSRTTISIKLEVTGTEPILNGIHERPLLHAFPDEHIDQAVPAYSLEEIAAEKMRTFLQVADRLNRGRSSGRAAYLHRARDVYDIAMLRRCELVDWNRVTEILPAKAEAKGLTFAKAADFLDPRIRKAYAGLWASTVIALTGEPLAFDDAWSEVANAASDVSASPRGHGIDVS